MADGGTHLSRAIRILGLTRGSLLGVVVRRLAMGAVLLIIVTAISFVLVSLTPGDPAREILGTQGTPQQYDALRRALGLNLPVYEQYWLWLRHAITGSLGTSIINGAGVGATIRARLPVTLSLVLGSLLVSLILGVALGVLSAVKGGLVDRAVDAGTLAGFAIPSFWAGAVLIAIFAVDLRWLPATGYVPVGQSVSGWLQSIVLPVVALSLGLVAAIAKQTREAMLDTLGSDYIRAAWASGLSAPSVYLRHGLKNAGMRVATVTGILAVGLLGGTVVVEVVFAVPGMGSLLVNATATHDLPVVQGVVVYFTVLVIVINLIVDLACVALNPKARAR